MQRGRGGGQDRRREGGASGLRPRRHLRLIWNCSIAGSRFSGLLRQSPLTDASSQFSMGAWECAAGWCASRAIPAGGSGRPELASVAMATPRQPAGAGIIGPGARRCVEGAAGPPLESPLCYFHGPPHFRASNKALSALDAHEPGRG